MEGGKTNMQTIGKYRIEKHNENGRFIVKVYNMNAKKLWNGLVHHYLFHSEQSQEDWIKGFIRNVESSMKIKEERKMRRKNIKNEFKVGDILYNSWGYEQTNIDFYQVVESKGKTVKIKEIRGRFTEKPAGSSMAGYVVPSKDMFIESAPIITKRVDIWGGVNFNSYSSLSRWDGKELYCSWYA